MNKIRGIQDRVDILVLRAVFYPLEGFPGSLMSPKISDCEAGQSIMVIRESNTLGSTR